MRVLEKEGVCRGEGAQLCLCWLRGTQVVGMHVSSTLAVLCHAMPCCACDVQAAEAKAKCAAAQQAAADALLQAQEAEAAAEALRAELKTRANQV